MDIWIRSQNRETLVKVNKLYIDEETITTGFLYDATLKIKNTGNYFIKSESDYRLGIYSSKKRALEVLGEIHEHIERQGQDYLLTDENGIIAGQKHYGFVYEMPKE